MKKFAIALAVAVSAGAGFAGPEAVGPTGMFVDVGGAALSGSGRVLRVGSVPVTNGASGAPTYYDATFVLDELADGRLAFIIDTAAGAAGPAITRSSSSLNFQPGKYKPAGSPCLWTLSQGSLEASGARRYSITKDDANCGNLSFPSAFSWSTRAPADGNGYLLQNVTAQQRALFPLDFAWGISNLSWERYSSSFHIRASAAGDMITVEGYSWSSGAPEGNSLATFVKQ